MNCKHLAFLIGLMIIANAFKTGYVWTQAWVNGSSLSKTALPKSIVKQIARAELALILLTKKELITTPSNGNTYLRCYLVNNTDTTAVIGRSDQTITGFTTEIFTGNAWHPYQHGFSSDCGNSYWTQALASNQVLSIHLDHAEQGPLKVPFRIKYGHNKQVIYSNVIQVNIDQDNFDRVGNRKK